MEGVNPFIKSNKHRMIMFLDELGVSGLFFYLEEPLFVHVFVYSACSKLKKTINLDKYYLLHFKHRRFIKPGDISWRSEAGEGSAVWFPD